MFSYFADFYIKENPLIRIRYFSLRFWGYQIYGIWNERKSQRIEIIKIISVYYSYLHSSAVSIFFVQVFSCAPLRFMLLIHPSAV